MAGTVELLQPTNMKHLEQGELQNSWVQVSKHLFGQHTPAVMQDTRWDKRKDRLMPEPEHKHKLRLSLGWSYLRNLLRSHVTERIPGTFLVVQWLRIHLPMQETRLHFLLQEDATGQPKPTCHKLSLCSRARASQLESSPHS